MIVRNIGLFLTTNFFFIRNLIRDFMVWIFQEAGDGGFVSSSSPASQKVERERTCVQAGTWVPAAEALLTAILASWSPAPCGVQREGSTYNLTFA